MGSQPRHQEEDAKRKHQPPDNSPSDPYESRKLRCRVRRGRDRGSRNGGSYARHRRRRRRRHRGWRRGGRRRQVEVFVKQGAWRSGPRGSDCRAGRRAARRRGRRWRRVRPGLRGPHVHHASAFGTGQNLADRGGIAHHESGVAGCAANRESGHVSPRVQAPPWRLGPPNSTILAAPHANNCRSAGYFSSKAGGSLYFFCSEIWRVVINTTCLLGSSGSFSTTHNSF